MTKLNAAPPNGANAKPVRALLVLFTTILGFVPLTADAREVNPDAPASSWRAYSAKDRLAYTTMTSIVCQSGNCNGVSIKACMDEVTRPPEPPGLQTMTIGEIAVGCIQTLKSQR
jgi:hypothetical protein